MIYKYFIRTNFILNAVDTVNVPYMRFGNKHFHVSEYQLNYKSLV